jgi:hypothetical protein
MRRLSLAARQVLASPERQFRYRVVLYDVFLGAPDLTVAQIVAGTHPLASLLATGHALDVTEFVADGLSWEEPGDKRASRVSFTLVEYSGRFHPDTGADGRFLRHGQLVRLLEGDATLPESDWVSTATCHIRGSVGFEQDRRTLAFQAQVVAYGRRATPKYLKQPFTSRTYGKRTEYGTMCQEIAAQQMGLSASEMGRFPASLGKVTQFAANSIVDMTPLEALDKLLETVGKVSDFDGDGVLRAYSRDVRRGPDKVFDKLDLIFRLAIPTQEIEAYNAVSVTGLDKNLTDVEQPSQALARAVIPVGFWRPTHRVRVFWTTDHSLRATDTQLKILTSVNDAIMLDVGRESYRQVSDYEGVIEVSITNFILILMALIALEIAAVFLLPDAVQVGPTGTGWTIPVGSIVQGALLTTIAFTLSISSSGQYEVVGVPLVPVYQEITSIVTAENTPDWAVHQKEIKNDYLNTVEELTEVAKLELLWEAAQVNPRELHVLNDWEIEVGDIIQVPVAGGQKWWVDSLRKTLRRGEQPDAVPVLEISGILVPEGV